MRHQKSKGKQLTGQPTGDDGPLDTTETADDWAVRIGGESVVSCVLATGAGDVGAGAGGFANILRG